MKRAPHYIAVEGPLRVGKSRLVGALADSLHATQLLDVTDNPHLGDFYRGRPSAAFRAQMHFLLERARRIQAAQVDASRTPIVADFMLEKDKLFACICLDDAELAIYENYYQYFKRQAPQPDLTVYLKATAGALRARLATEKDGMEARVSEVYLEGAVQAYDHFFQHYRGSDVVIVDTSNTNILESPEDLKSLLADLTKPVAGTQFFLPLES